MTISVAEETRNATSASDNRTHSNRRSRENKHGDGKALAVRDRVSSKEPICHEYGQKNK